MKAVYRLSITMIEKIVLPLLAASCVVLSAYQEVKIPELKALPAPEPTASPPPTYVLTDTEIRGCAPRKQETLGKAGFSQSCFLLAGDSMQGIEASCDI